MTVLTEARDAAAAAVAESFRRMPPASFRYYVRLSARGVDGAEQVLGPFPIVGLYQGVLVVDVDGRPVAHLDENGRWYVVDGEGYDGIGYTDVLIYAKEER